MLLILPPREKLIIEDQVSEQIAYAPLFGLRAVSLCFLFSSARKAYYTSSGVRTDSVCSLIEPSRDNFMFLILRPRGKLIIQYQVSEG